MKFSKIHKILILSVITIASISLLAGCGSTKESASTKEPYKIGAVIDVSGSSSSLGVPEKNTLEMEVKKINDKGGISGHPIELIVRDTESDESKANLAAKKLIQEDKVSAIIGTSSSGTTMAILDTVQKSNIPMISMASSDKIVNPVKDRKFIFSTAQPVNLVAENIADYLIEKKISKVAFLSVNNTFGDSGKTEFEKQAAKKKVTIVSAEKFDAKDSDMTAQLTKVKAQNPEAVIIWATPPSASNITKNFRTLDFKVPLIHSHGVGNQNFIDTAGDAAEGVVFPIGKIMVAEQLPDSDPQSKVLKDYVKDFEAKFGPRSTFGGHAWDAIHMLEIAMEKAGSDPIKVRDELEKLSNFNGVTGVFNYSDSTHSGLKKDALIMVEVKDKKLNMLK